MPDPTVSPNRFLCAGETLGMFVPNPNRSGGGYPDEFQLTAAGAESNVAAYLSRLGNSVDWVSRLGGDHVGAFILAYLQSEGVTTTAVEVDNNAPTAIAVKEPGKNKSTVRYYRRGSAASKLGSEHVDSIIGLAPAFVHLTGITAALSDSAMEFMEKAFDVLPSRALVSFDVNLRPTLWAKPPAEILLRFASLSETAFVGLDEANALWGCETPDQVRALIPQPLTLIVKQGPVGATVFRGDSSEFVQSLTVELVEPIGAGDAFAAGFLDSHRRGESTRSSARAGTVVACASLGSHKDVGEMPSREYIRKLIEVSDDDWAKERYSQ